MSINDTIRVVSATLSMILVGFILISGVAVGPFWFALAAGLYGVSLVVDTDAEKKEALKPKPKPDPVWLEALREVDEIDSFISGELPPHEWYPCVVQDCENLCPTTDYFFFGVHYGHCSQHQELPESTSRGKVQK